MEVIVPDIIDEFNLSRISSSDAAEETPDPKNDMHGMLLDFSIQSKVGHEFESNDSDKLSSMTESPASETQETSSNLEILDSSDNITVKAERLTNEANNSELIDNISIEDEETPDPKNDMHRMLLDFTVQSKVGHEFESNDSDKLSGVTKLPASETQETSSSLEILDSSDNITIKAKRLTNKANNSELMGNISVSETTGDSELVFNEFSERIAVPNYDIHKAISMSGNKLFCELCQKVFTTQGGFKKHLRLHVGDVDLFCSECGKGFCFKSHLESHMRTHTGEKPFECNVCQRRFTLNGDLKKHQLLHTGERPYTCKTCHKSFTQLGDLNIHIRIHTGVKPFVCGICHRGFTHKSNLTQHHRTHTGEKPYPCHFCGKHFSQNVQLNRHLLTHGCPKPFTCPICQKGFTAKYRYTKHLSSKHKHS